MNFTFIISFIAVIFISLCFTKKRFWEYRYIILVIGAGVALIATLTTNLLLRNSLPTKVENIEVSNLSDFYMPDSLQRQFFGLYNVPKLGVIKDYKFLSIEKDDFKKKNKDEHQIQSKIIIYNQPKDNTIYFGFMVDKDSRDNIESTNVYIEQSPNDSIAYFCKKKKVYDVDNNYWISSLSMPRISDIYVLSLPPKYYAMIPDSLIHNPPY